MRFLDNIPLLILVVVTIFLGIAPLGATPHLVEKWNMLMTGTLTKPLDIFDFLMHGTPAVLLILKLIRMAQIRKAGS